MTYRQKLVRTTLYCYLPIVVLFATIRMLSAFGVLNFLNNFYGNLVLNLVVQVGLLFVFSIFLFPRFLKAKPKDAFKFYRFRRIRWQQVLLAILIGVVVYILNVLITTFFNAFLSAFGYTFSYSSGMTSYPFWLLIINLIFTAVLPGICEETAHRGLLLNGLSPMGAKKALIISSLLFGLLHLNIEQVFYATLIGLVVGFITIKSESIYPAMIIHFMNNAISVFMGYSSFHHLGLESGFNILSTWLANTPMLALLFMIILIAALIMFLMYLMKKLFRYSTIDRMNEMQKAIIGQYEREKFFKDVENLSKGETNDGEAELQTKFFENFDARYQEARQAGMENEIDKQLFRDLQSYRGDAIAKVLLITTFVIVGVITLFTLIWGIL